MSDNRPIGIFDSGVGGLTVVGSVLERCPGEPVVYIGDSARSPYGSRSLEEIREFAIEIATALVARDVKMIVVACNSVEVAAIADVAMSAQVPVAGVIDPAVRAAIRVTRSGMVGLIGTEATVASGAYERAVDRTGEPIALVSYAAPLLAGFIEQGDTSSSELRAAVREYLEPLARTDVDALILGCTHYPLIADLIAEVMGADVKLVSSAEETAKDVVTVLERFELGADPGAVGPQPVREFLCTGEPEQFQSVADLFLGESVAAVERIELARVGG